MLPNREFLNEVIAFCARLLDVKKPIRLTIEYSHPDAMAAVRKLKNGVEVSDLSEDYDEIELFLYENKELREGLGEWQTVIVWSEIIHELVHIKHPDWDEESVADEDARITGLIRDYLEKRLNVGE